LWREVFITTGKKRDDCRNASLLQWSLLWYSHAFFFNSHTSPKQLLIL
jgi:hypothetical protein